MDYLQLIIVIVFHHLFDSHDLESTWLMFFTWSIAVGRFLFQSGFHLVLPSSSFQTALSDFTITDRYSVLADNLE